MLLPAAAARVSFCPVVSFAAFVFAFAARVDGLAGLDEAWANILFDPQTSGGLLLAASPSLLPRLLADLAADGVTAAIIGEARAGAGRLLVRHSETGKG